MFWTKDGWKSGPERLTFGDRLLVVTNRLILIFYANAFNTINAVLIALIAPGSVSDFTIFIAFMIAVDGAVQFLRRFHPMRVLSASDLLRKIIITPLIALACVAFSGGAIFVLAENSTDLSRLTYWLGHVVPIARHYDGVFSNSIISWLALNCLIIVFFQCLIATKIGRADSDSSYKGQNEPYLVSGLFLIFPFTHLLMMYWVWWGPEIDKATSGGRFNMNLEQGFYPFLVFGGMPFAVVFVYGLCTTMYEAVRAFDLREQRVSKSISENS